MKPKIPTTHPPTVDRRSGQDRRKKDMDPPGGRERRRSVEPRRPEVVEIDLTPSQWAALDEPATLPTRKREP